MEQGTNLGHTPDTFIDNQIESRAPKEWLTTEEAAEYLGLTPGALRNMTSNGSVPYYKLGRRNRYQLEELRSLLLQNKKGENHGL